MLGVAAHANPVTRLGAILVCRRDRTQTTLADSAQPGAERRGGPL